MEGGRSESRGSKDKTWGTALRKGIWEWHRGKGIEEWHWERALGNGITVPSLAISPSWTKEKNLHKH